MKNTNDHSSNPPALRAYMHGHVLGTLEGFSTLGPAEMAARVKAAGFQGIQFSGAKPGQMEACRAAGLGIAESGRLNIPEEADNFARQFADAGVECATVHLGWGFEDDEEAARLIGELLEASEKHSIALYPETHRATVLQDMWRTIGFLKRFPQLRLNADFSHWYTGQEMTYGGMDWKLDRIAPVFERVSFMHGRIGDPGAMQVEIRGANDDRIFVNHFRDMWTRTFRSFLQSAKAGDFLCFTPEILAAKSFYSRTKLNERGEEVEVADRWEQSLILVDIAKACFAKAGAGD